MIDRYCTMIKEDQGQIHRLEDWGRRQLAYPINKIHKAHYVLMNVECSLDILQEMQNAFRFNDAVIRNLIIERDGPETEPSPLIRARDERESHGDRDSQCEHDIDEENDALGESDNEDIDTLEGA
jgi:small subunit ribosomal protein S6